MISRRAFKVPKFPTRKLIPYANEAKARGIKAGVFN